MMKTKRISRILIGLLILVGASLSGIAVAQDNERSRFVRFVERQISTPDRKITLGRIEGALSSNVRISEITIADRRGVWLTIENAALEWSRLALLRGRLSIDSLTADKLIIARTPLPGENNEPIEEGAEFSLPSLPVAVRINEFAIDSVEIAEGVIGPAARLKIDGAARLESGQLDARLNVNRQDKPGSLQLAARFDDSTRQLAIDLELSEPEGGVVANALNVEDAPALTFKIAGEGPLSDFKADVSLVADSETLLSGTTRIADAGDGGLRFVTDVSGNIEPLVTSLYDPFVEGGTSLKIDMTRGGGGQIVISQGAFKSGVADLSFTGTFGSDGVPTALELDGSLEREDGQPLALPGGGGDSTLRSATIKASLGDTAATTFEAEIAVKDLSTALIEAPTATLTANGSAQNLDDAANRAVNFTVTGRADDIGSNNAGFANAVGSRLSIDAEGSWRAGQPVDVKNAAIETDTLKAAFAGTVGSEVKGTYSLDAQSLAAFSALANRELGGAIELKADGSIGFGGLFDITLDATAQNLAVGADAADGLLKGTTTLSGAAARTEEGFTFKDFRLSNPQMGLLVDGALSDSLADLTARLELASLEAVDPKLSGAVVADLAVKGRPQNPAITANVTSPAIDFGQQSLTDLDTRFEGTLSRPDDGAPGVAGTLSLDARYAGEPVSLEADIDSRDGTHRLKDLALSIVDARADGGLTYKDGLITGELDLDIPELKRLAPLLLTDAAGTIDAKATFTTAGENQNVRLDGTLRNVEIASAQLGFGSLGISADDVFGVPILDGRADIRDLSVGGFDVRTLSLVAAREGEATDMTLKADLGEGTLDAAGRLERADDGFAATLSSFRLAGRGEEAVLRQPTRVVVAGQSISVDQMALAVAGGTVTLGGTLGEKLDFEATIKALPLSLANLVQPDLGLEGVVNGDIDLEGTRDKPAVTARLDATGVTAKMLSERGIAPITLNAAGSFRDGSGSLDTLTARVAGGTVTASGRLGDDLAVKANVDGLPLSLANAFVPDLALSGTVSGSADITGSLEDPQAAFKVAVAEANAAPLRAANIGPASATAEGRYARGQVDLASAVLNVGGGTLKASGEAGQRLDLKISLADLPLAIANGFEESLGLQGVLSGEATVTGRATRPQATFKLSAPSVTTAATRSAGLPAGSLNAAGRFDGSTVTLSEAVLRIGGGEVRATGSAGQRLALGIDITNLPLALANGFAPELGLGGTLSGRVDASGSVARPSARFDLSVARLTAAPAAQAGIGGVDARARGSFANNIVSLDTLTANGSGLDVNASGRVPLSGSGLSLKLNARAPLSLANRILAERGATLAGDALVDATVTGSLANPNVSGSVRATGITYRDPQLNLVIQNGALDAALAGDRVTIRSMQANLGEGTISVSGSVGIKDGFPADLRIALREARYADGELFAVTLSGDLTVTGRLTADPLIGGRILIDRAEIAVPETFGNSAALIDVNYLGATRRIMETLRRARVGPYAETADDGGSGASGARLDITVDAPARVFIRGRGIDAELGGQVRLTGPVSNIAPVGRFELRRGRIVILGQRIEFVEGSVTLIGDLNPTIRLVGETTKNSITARVIVEGQAQDPQIRFESSPELPQDEVLAQLIFGRSIADLSGFQLAQLAAAVAELAGGGSGPGLLDQIRVFAGLDNLEIVTDEQGNTSAEAGRYIADNIYLGVRAGARSSGVTVNLDITRKLKVRAEALTDETNIGVYYELEYD